MVVLLFAATSCFVGPSPFVLWLLSGEKRFLFRAGYSWNETGVEMKRCLKSFFWFLVVQIKYKYRTS